MLDSYNVEFLDFRFRKKHVSVLNSLEPDQDRHFVDPDLGPNCLQMLSDN